MRIALMRLSELPTDAPGFRDRPYCLAPAVVFPREERSLVGARDFQCRANLPDLPAFKPHDLLAQPADLVELMAHQNHRATPLRDFLHSPQTFSLELQVADCQHFVYQ